MKRDDLRTCFCALLAIGTSFAKGEFPNVAFKFLVLKTWAKKLLTELFNHLCSRLLFSQKSRIGSGIFKSFDSKHVVVVLVVVPTLICNKKKKSSWPFFSYPMYSAQPLVDENFLDIIWHVGFCSI